MQLDDRHDLSKSAAAVSDFRTDTGKKTVEGRDSGWHAMQRSRERVEGGGRGGVGRLQTDPLCGFSQTLGIMLQYLFDTVK